ncbi:MAG: hypothetical protein KatS3mg056_0465 [Chloroflexus sp.]|nr:MAG: hypothetical protein KatS3mg056_0465 [Chloroflexus sp.]
MSRRTPILVVGLTAAGSDGLSSALIERVLRADLLVGGRRHLAAFPDFCRRTVNDRGECGTGADPSARSVAKRRGGSGAGVG